MLGVDAARIGVSQGYQLVYRPDVPLSARRLNMIGSTLKFHGFLHPCNAALICLSFSVTYTNKAMAQPGPRVVCKSEWNISLAVLQTACW